VAKQSALRKEEHMGKPADKRVLSVIRGLGGRNTPLDRLIHERMSLGIVNPAV
jgi:hypothetical protein